MMARQDPWGAIARSGGIGIWRPRRGAQRRWPEWVTDVVLAGCVLVVGALTTGAASTADARPRDVGFAALLAAVSLPYVARRRAPTPVLVTSLVALTVMWVVGYDTGALGMSLLAGAYTVAAHASPAGQAIAALAVGAMSLALTVTDPAFGVLGGVTTVCTLGISAALGWGTRERLRLAGRVAAQEVLLARRDAELARGQARLAELGATADRAAVAREVHDALAHALSSIAVQAGVAARLSAQDPTLGQRALGDIADHARSALAEMRSVIAALRGPSEVTSAGPSPGVPPGPTALTEALAVGAASRLDLILDDNARAGLTVELQSRGDLATVPPGMRHDVLRVVQEALTNVRRHSRSAVARLALDVGSREVTVLVDDPGPALAPAGADPAAGGFGLAGMRDRLRPYGGTVTAGPTPASGFRVEARVPLPGAAADGAADGTSR